VSADAVTFDKLGVGEVAGDVALLGDRVIVSCVRKGMNAVGVTGLALDHVEWASLGVAFGDAPPPVLVTSRDQAYALSWERVDASSSRTLAVTKLLPSAALAWSIAEPDASESFAADAAFAGAHGLVAWDTSRGIKVSALTPGSQLVPLPLSAEGALASAPRVVRRKTDWVVVWSERKVEALADGAPRTQPGELIESPGEHRAYEWLAFAVVADDGTTKAPPKRITAETGHVGRFDLLLAADDSTTSAVASSGSRSEVIEPRRRSPSSLAALAAGRRPSNERPRRLGSSTRTLSAGRELSRLASLDCRASSPPSMTRGWRSPPAETPGSASLALRWYGFAAASLPTIEALEKTVYSSARAILRPRRPAPQPPLRMAQPAHRQRHWAGQHWGP